jgi:hypothetical protein
MLRRIGTMAALTVNAIVLRRDICGNHFSSGRGQTVPTGEQDLYWSHRGLCFRAEYHLGREWRASFRVVKCQPRDCCSLLSKNLCCHRSIRLLIFANGVSRDVEVSPTKGEKPQSSLFPVIPAERILPLRT